MAVRIYEKDGSVRIVSGTAAKPSKAETVVRKAQFLLDPRMAEAYAAVEAAAQRLKEALDKSDRAKALYGKEKVSSLR